MRIKSFAAIVLILSSSLGAVAQQVDWSRFDRMIDRGEYKSAYARASQVFDTARTSPNRLAAAYCMAQAAARYREDAYDSAVARYRALLPDLEPLEQSLCYAFLGSHDTALVQDSLLAATPVERIRWYCNISGKESGTNVTPTVLDVLVRMAQDYGGDRRKAVALQRRLCRLHQADADDVRIWNDVRLLDLMARVPNAKMPDDTMLHYIDKYRGTRSQYYTKFHRMLAQRLLERDNPAEALRWCDSALAIAPGSEGGVECYNLRGQILEKQVALFAEGLCVVPGQSAPQRVTHRNVEHLWFRVVAYDGDFDKGYDKDKARLLKAAPIAAWDTPVGTDEGRAAYRSESSIVALPPLETGRYLLLVSPTADFKAEGYMAYEVQCTDMQLVSLAFGQGLLLDRTTGRPIAGQDVRVEERQRDGTYKTLAVATTDKDGRYDLGYSQWNWRMRTVVERGGFTLRTQYNYYSNSTDTSWRHEVELRTDRPVYRLGDTLQAALLCFVANGVDALVEKSAVRKVELLDANRKAVDTASVVTDDYGMATVRFVIPDNCLPGSFSLRVTADGIYLGGADVNVEEYKQPKFMVTLGTEGAAAPRFGVPYTVRGLASSYSAVPVGGARVQYTVRRSFGGFRWWGSDKGIEVASGETTTAADGSFAVVFTPEPDSNYELASRTAFRFTVEVTVTDLSGESHNADKALYVGFKNAYLALDGDEILYQDINGTPLDGDVSVRVERLRQPVVPRLQSPVIDKGVHNTLGEAEWRRQFPNLAYDEQYNDPANWKVESVKLKVEKGKGKVESGGWSEGVYRITLAAADADTLAVCRTVMPKDCRRVYSQQLLWSDVDRTTAHVGDTVTVRFGSRHRDVEVYCLLRIGNEERSFSHVRVSDGIEAMQVVVDSAMLGGFRVDLYTVRYGVERHLSHEVSVPFAHKQLKVEIATFRDRLRPGEREEWTVKVKGEKGVEESCVVLTMYDDALNTYRCAPYWGISPWRTNSSAATAMIQLSGDMAHYLKPFKYRYENTPSPTVWSLKRGLPYLYGRRGGGIVTMQGNLRKMYKSAAPVIEVGAAENGARLSSDDIARMPGNSVENTVAAVGGMGYDDAGTAAVESVMADDEEETEEDEMFAMAGTGEEPLQVRTNLNTLAFFAAGLRTDTGGAVTYRFTVPELLTRWNVRGLAYTRDIKVGSLNRTLVTDKPLMVQPNMPRFLRNGDSLSLLAKVVVAEPHEEKDVLVTMLLTDAATGDTICHDRQMVKVKDAARIAFDVQVPQGVYVVTYEIVARTEDMSDGERGQLPVLSNSQAVTVSQAMYINGVGEKHYRMPEFLEENGSREPRLVAAELTDNPVWLAVKVMPFYKTAENPSTLYLANQYYVNTLGQRILKELNIGDFAALKGSPSRLTMNEDVKQTLMKATPWVRDAESEEEQMAAVANYFDRDALNRTMEKSIKELQQRQNGDGGWSWMPEGNSSVWVTQQVLRRISAERYNVDDALRYIDSEQQRYYEKYIKPHLAKRLPGRATDIDYLYTRSFYGKAKTEAYRYYYSNALKSYKDYENLYTQAQLALIFHRHGDRKAALDILHRLKQKALQSDEMGMYWRDNRSGWFWYQRPVETQALLIQAFAEITPNDTACIGQMQQWLLKQKQTTHWGSDRATVEAIAALMVNPAGATDTSVRSSMTVFGEPLSAAAAGPEGYRAQRWTGDALDSLRVRRSPVITLGKSSPGIAWGAVYYQFADDMDKIPSSDMGIVLKRTFLAADGRAATAIKVGDKIKVRIDIQCDRAMDYLELVDARPSCVEPVSTRSGWHWNSGVGFYVAVTGTDTRCYVEHMDKGRYAFEYEVYVTNSGHFMAGPVTMQCMYAPEFRAVEPGIWMSVEP